MGVLINNLKSAVAASFVLALLAGPALAQDVGQGDVATPDVRPQARDDQTIDPAPAPGGGTSQVPDDPETVAKDEAEAAEAARRAAQDAAERAAIEQTATAAEAEDAEQARPLLDQLRDADPTDAARIVRQIALVWDRSGSASADLLLRRGRDATEAGEFDIAIGHLTALTDHAPDFAEGWHSRAKVFYRQEAFGLALHDLEKTLALNPDHFDAIYGLAVVFEELERVPQAFALYEKVLAMHPNHEGAANGVERLKTRVIGTEI